MKIILNMILGSQWLEPLSLTLSHFSKGKIQIRHVGNLK